MLCLELLKINHKFFIKSEKTWIILRSKVVLNFNWLRERKINVSNSPFVNIILYRSEIARPQIRCTSELRLAT